MIDVCNRSVSLRKPSQFYTGRTFLYNPLWKHIYRSLNLYLLETDGRKSQSMYVDQRVDPNGICVRDVSTYLKDCPGQLMIVRGPAGVGKTTFLHNALARDFDFQKSILVWVDVLSDTDRLAGNQTTLSQVKEIIQSRLGREAVSRSCIAEWHKFLLSRVGAPDGLAGVFVSEISEFGAVCESSKGVFLEWIKSAQENRLQYTRSLIAFLRERFSQTTCIIIDNVDQLPAADILEIVEYADILSKGSKGFDAPADDLASVVMAVRPVSLGSVSRSTRFVRIGHLFAPNIAEVFMRRLEMFFKDFEGRASRGYVISDDDGHEVDSREIMEHEFDRGSAHETVRMLLLKVAEAALSDPTPYGSSLMALIQKLSNYNTRCCLLATGQYLASGHLDWRGLTDVLVGRKRLHDVLTPRKTLMALILGVSAIYDTKSSWLVNLFNDGHPDSFGVLMRLRVLKGFQSASGTSFSNQNAIAEKLGLCFNYPLDRVAQVCSDLLSVGLLEEKTSDSFEISVSGVAYLDRMLIDFQYLQHVLVDAYSPQEYLVPCTRHDESASIRFQRVVKFTNWVRDIEVDDLARAMSGGFEGVYTQLYGQELFCEVMAMTLKDAYEFLPKTDRDETAWMSLHHELTNLLEKANFGSVAEEAKMLQVLRGS